MRGRSQEELAQDRAVLQAEPGRQGGLLESVAEYVLTYLSYNLGGKFADLWWLEYQYCVEASE